MAQNYLNSIRYKSNEIHLLNTHENYKFEKLGGYLVPSYQRVNMCDHVSEASIASRPLYHLTPSQEVFMLTLEFLDLLTS